MPSRTVEKYHLRMNYINFDTSNQSNNITSLPRNCNINNASPSINDMLPPIDENESNDIDDHVINDFRSFNNDRNIN